MPSDGVGYSPNLKAVRVKARAVVVLDIIKSAMERRERKQRRSKEERTGNPPRSVSSTPRKDQESITVCVLELR